MYKLAHLNLRWMVYHPEIQHLLHLNNLDHMTFYKTNRFIQSLMDTRIEEDSCIKRAMTATVTYYIGSGHDDHSTLYLCNICDIKKCRCDEYFNAANHTPTERKLHCFRQLAAGKCVDRYMQHTLGAALFPKMYTTGKHK